MPAAWVAKVAEYVSHLRLFEAYGLTCKQNWWRHAIFQRDEK